jgi:hypothetical protein
MPAAAPAIAEATGMATFFATNLLASLATLAAAPSPLWLVSATPDARCEEPR